jgi:hypothetical protein
MKSGILFGLLLVGALSFADGRTTGTCTPQEVSRTAQRGLDRAQTANPRERQNILAQVLIGLRDECAVEADKQERESGNDCRYGTISNENGEAVYAVFRLQKYLGRVRFGDRIELLTPKRVAHPELPNARSLDQVKIRVVTSTGTAPVGSVGFVDADKTDFEARGCLQNP